MINYINTIVPLTFYLFFYEYLPRSFMFPFFRRPRNVLLQSLDGRSEQHQRWRFLRTAYGLHKMNSILYIIGAAVVVVIVLRLAGIL